MPCSYLLPGAEPAAGAEGGERPGELHAPLPEAAVEGVRRGDVDGEALGVAQRSLQRPARQRGTAPDLLVVLACIQGQSEARRTRVSYSTYSFQLKAPPLTSRERCVGDVVVEELAPLHEHEGEVGAGPVEVGDQSLADRSGGGQGRAGLGYLASGNGHTCIMLVVSHPNCDYRR